MRIDTLLSTIILVSFLVTILMAVGSYAAYKLRENRGPVIELTREQRQRIGVKYPAELIVREAEKVHQALGVRSGHEI